MIKKAKIVATIGPSTANLKSIEELVKAGADVFRLNFSHGTHEDHLKNIEMIRKIEKKLSRPLGILQDIAGPKIRLGMIDGTMELLRSKRYILANEEKSDGKIIPFPHPDIIKDITVGAKIFFADGTLRASATKIFKDSVEIEVEVGGLISSRKGVNFPDLAFSIPSLTKKDLTDLAFGVESGVDIVAISFVKNKNDVIEARSIASAYGGGVLIVPKIEKKDALENIDEILDVSDGVMVARGDLGVEIGFEKVPVAQKLIISKANEKGIAVITATQMLTSMINSAYPTRAEVSDVANALLDGTDAVMLSDETAVGKYPTKAVQTLTDTIIETEKIYPYCKFGFSTEKSDAIAAGAVKLSENINPDALVVFTNTGASAKKISRFRPSQTIITATHSMEISRQLCLFWGVKAVFILENHKNSDELTQAFLKEGLKQKWLKRNGLYVFTMGYPTGQTGSTNLIRMIDEGFFERIGL